MNKPIKSVIALTVIFLSLLTACNPQSAPAAAPEATPSGADSTAAPLPASETPESTPTITPTPVFQTSSPINAANAVEITSLARWGLGEFAELAWSPDGLYAATGSGAGVFVLNAEDGSLFFNDYAGSVQAMAFSADSQRLAVATTTQVIEYSLSSGERLSTLDVDFRPYDMAYSGITFEIVISGKQTDVFGNTTAQIIARLMDGEMMEEHSLDLQVTKNNLDVAADGSALMNYSYEREQFEFFNTGGQRTGSLPKDSASAMSKTFNAGLFAMCNFNESYAAGPISVYRTSGQLLSTVTVDANVVLGMTISPDGNTLSVVLERRIEQYSLPQGALLNAVDFSGYGSPSPDLMHSFDGRQMREIASGDKLGDAIAINESSPVAVSISADHQRLVICYAGPEPESEERGLWADVIDTRTMQRERSIFLRTGSYTSSDIGMFKLLADGETLAYYIIDDDEVKFRNVVNGNKPDPFPLNFPPTAVGVSADNQYILAADNDGNAELWPYGAAEPLVDLNNVEQYIGPYDAVFSADGQTAALSGSDLLLVWSLPDGDKRELESNGHIAISPDGLWLAQHHGNNMSMMIYDLPARQLEVEWDFSGFAEEITFSSDSEVLMVRGYQRIDFIAPLSGEILHTLNYDVLDMELSADGVLLATVSYDGTVRLWGIP